MDNTINKTLNLNSLIYLFMSVSIIFSTLFYFENDLIFIGTKHSQQYRDKAFLSIDKTNFKKESFKVEQINLEYFINDKQSSKNVLFLGGNAEDVLFNLNFLNNLFPEYNIYTLNYPNFGGSEGVSSEKNINKILDIFIEKKLKDKPLIIFGRSVGTGFSIRAAAKNNNVEKLIVVSPYFSMEKVALSHYPFVTSFLTFLFMENKIESYLFADKLNIPVLVVYANEDNVIKNKETEDIIPYFKKGDVLKVFNEDHNSILFSEKTITKIQSFTQI